VNLFLSVLLQELVKRGDGCTWYFVNLSMDVSIGLTLSYCMHQVIEYIATKHDIDALKSGVYFSEKEKVKDENINYRIWLLQLVIWCIIVLLVKLVIFSQQLYFADWLAWFGETCLADFEGNPDLKLIFVMVMLPLILNSVQYWVQDNFLSGDKILAEMLERQKYLDEQEEIDGGF
jgi:hypothetical protein